MDLGFTVGARYAVTALAHLAGQDADGLVSAEAIAGARSLPKQFLSKALRALSAAGIVRGAKGVHGGYALAKPADRITLLELVEAVDGKIVGGASPWEVKDGNFDRRLGPILDGAAETVRRHLASVRLTDLLDGKANARPRGRRKGE
jgi:Rrf2 family protein